MDSWLGVIDLEGNRRYVANGGNTIALNNVIK